MADRQMAERLTEHAPVLYVDPPVSHLTPRKNPAVAASLAEPRLRVVAPRIARLTPVAAPYPTRPAMTPLTDLLVRRALRRAVHALGGNVRAVVSVWLFLDAFGAFADATKVYWWQDDPAAATEVTSGWGQRARLARADRRLAREADVIVAVNEDIAARWRERGHRAAFVPNGCDLATFATVEHEPGASDVALPAPVAGFVGHLNRRIDVELLERVAARGMSLLLIGPVDPGFRTPQFDRLVARPNVRYLGPRPYASLPSYYRHIDVGLVPYLDNAFNRGSFPLKTLEYLAAGKPVVSTALPAVRWLDTDLIALASDPADFETATRRIGGLAQSPAEIARRRAFAATHSWSDRARRLVDALDLHAAETATG
jgi:teichuronic acid biosynthesis glycosyltransferase TuaH